MPLSPISIQVSPDFIQKYHAEIKQEKNKVKKIKQDLAKAKIELKSIGGQVLSTYYVQAGEVTDDDNQKLALKAAIKNKVNLFGINLSGWNLTGFNFSNLNLGCVDFSGADLSDADFSGAELINARFDGANLTGTKFANTDFRSTKQPTIISSDQVQDFLKGLGVAVKTNQQIKQELDEQNQRIQDEAEYVFFGD